MSFELDVDAARWRRGLTTVAETTPGLVPVIKGNGYGFGRDLLAARGHAAGRRARSRSARTPRCPARSPPSTATSWC